MGKLLSHQKIGANNIYQIRDFPDTDTAVQAFLLADTSHLCDTDAFINPNTIKEYYCGNEKMLVGSLCTWRDDGLPIRIKYVLFNPKGCKIMASWSGYYPDLSTMFKNTIIVLDPYQKYTGFALSLTIS